MDNFETVSKFDRILGGLLNVSLKTSPATIKNVQNVTGKTETFIVQTVRHHGEDWVFIEHIDEDGVTRTALPPKVAAAIIRQRDSLSTRSRSLASKASMQARIDAGEVLGFKRKKA